MSDNAVATSAEDRFSRASRVVNVPEMVTGRVGDADGTAVVPAYLLITEPRKCSNLQVVAQKQVMDLQLSWLLYPTHQPADRIHRLLGSL